MNYWHVIFFRLAIIACLLDHFLICKFTLFLELILMTLLFIIKITIYIANKNTLKKFCL